MAGKLFTSQVASHKAGIQYVHILITIHPYFFIACENAQQTSPRTGKIAGQPFVTNLYKVARLSTWLFCVAERPLRCSKRSVSMAGYNLSCTLSVRSIILKFHVVQIPCNYRATPFSTRLETMVGRLVQTGNGSWNAWTDREWSPSS